MWSKDLHVSEAEQCSMINESNWRAVISHSFSNRFLMKHLFVMRAPSAAPRLGNQLLYGCPCRSRPLMDLHSEKEGLSCPVKRSLTLTRWTWVSAVSCITLHYIAFHCITLHYIALHCITLHYIALHCITLHYCTCKEEQPSPHPCEIHQSCAAGVCEAYRAHLQAFLSTDYRSNPAANSGIVSR